MASQDGGYAKWGLALGIAIAGGSVIHAGRMTLATDEVPAGGEVTVTAGEATAIYGARAACDADAPPSFDSVIERGLETAPAHGELSDGGVGERYSRRCEGNVPIRIIDYAAAADYVGEDTVVIYGDVTNITVVAPEVE